MTGKGVSGLRAGHDHMAEDLLAQCFLHTRSTQHYFEKGEPLHPRCAL